MCTSICCGVPVVVTLVSLFFPINIYFFWLLLEVFFFFFFFFGMSIPMVSILFDNGLQNSKHSKLTIS